MQAWSQLAEFLSRNIWPLLVLVVVFLFKKELGALIGKMVKLKVHAGKFKIETALQQHLSPELLGELVRDPAKLSLQAESRRVTILYSDIRGFTQIHETSPADLAALTHLYFTNMTRVVFDHQGTLDRYAGHALIAYWGAPIDMADSAARACRAALEMLERLEKEINPKLAAMKLPPLRVAVALTTGTVIVGNLGSEQRFNYTILGDSLNIAARLCALNGQYGTDILITEFTREEVGDLFELKALAPEGVQVKGKQQPVRIFELLGRRNTPAKSLE